MSNFRFSPLICLFVVLYGLQMTVPSVRAGCTSDADGDGACDGSDLCPNTIPRAVVDKTGCPRIGPGDFDGDANLADIAAFQNCFGDFTAYKAVPQSCPVLDFNSNEQIEDSDFAAFQSLLSSP